MITFKEFEEVWDESRVLSDIVRVLSLAEEKNYIEVKVYENIGGDRHLVIGQTGC